MEAFLLVSMGIFMFSLLVVLHEYGHFLVAKRNGVEVEEFGLGFPPKLLGKTMGKGIFRSYYTINLLPLGGFVKLKGEHDTASGKGSYGAQSLRVKTRIILAGVFVNFLTAAVLFTILAFIGIPRLLPAAPIIKDKQFTIASDTKISDSRAIISYVAEGSPAEAAGVQLGDQLMAIGDVQIMSNEQMSLATPQYEAKDTSLYIRRGGEDLVLPVSLNSSEAVQTSIDDRQSCLAQASSEELTCPQAKGYLGVSGTDFVLQRSTWSSLITGPVLALQFTKVTIQGLASTIGSLLQGDTQTASDSVSGPVGIFFILKEGANFGFRFILMIIAIISVTLAVMNALPIPALDGGRIMLTILHRKVLKKPLTKKREERIVGYSMTGLIALMILITVIDVRRFF